MGWSWDRKSKEDKDWWGTAVRWAMLMASPMTLFLLYNVVTDPRVLAATVVALSVGGAFVAVCIFVVYCMERYM